MSDTFAQWPEKFVYVCPATGAAPIWGLAFDHAPDRIAAMVILVGRKNSSAADEREARIPSNRMKKKALSLGLTKKKIHILEGIGESLIPWREACAIATRIGDCNDIVFNIKAGLKEQTVGTLQGYRSDTMPRLYLCSSGSKGPTLGLYSNEDKESDLCLASTEWSQDLREIMAQQKLLWTREEESASLKVWRTDHAQTNMISKLMARKYNEIGRIVRAWNNSAIYFDNDRKREQTSGAWETRDDYVKLEGPAKELAASLDGADVLGAKVFLRSPEVVEFLKGGWLETYVFSEVQNALRGHPSRAVVKMSVEFAFARPEGIGEAKTLGEIDVVVQWANNVLPIECKASHSPDHSRAIMALDEWRTCFGGPSGTALFVAPFIHRRHSGYNGLVSDLQLRSLTPLLGWKRVKNIGSLVKRLVEATMP